MDYLADFLNWASKSENANVMTTVAAALGIPGAVWGVYLFVRWLQGKGVDTKIDAIHSQNTSLKGATEFLIKELVEWRRTIHLNEFSQKLDSLPAETSIDGRSHLPYHTPTLDDIEQLTRESFAALPSEFQALVGNVQIRIADFPEEDVLSDLAGKREIDQLGFFHGIGLAQAGAFAPIGHMPNMIWLYRRPILDYWAKHDETLGHIVTHVLIRQIARHFGLSDDDMEAIEAAAG